jgi:hypothetical protein
MTEKRAIFEKAKRLVKIIMGAELPKWVYPVTAGAALSPVLAHALEEAGKKKHLIQHAPMLMRGGAPTLPTGLRYVYAPSLKHASADGKPDIVKLAQGLERMRELMDKAKKRGRRRRATNTIDTKPSVSSPGEGGRSMRGRSSGSMRLGSGGGYGK